MKATISLTEFVDFVLKAGSPKLTKAKSIKNKPDYSPQNDFYKPFRDYVSEFHKRGTVQFANSGSDVSSDPKKLKHYSLLIRGYKLFLGTKHFEWFQPPREACLIDEIQIAINPELGLLYKGKRYVIKLFLKEDDLSKDRVNTILGLMEHVLRPDLDEQAVIGLLDVRNNKLYQKTVTIPGLMLAVKAECAYLASIWDEL